MPRYLGIFLVVFSIAYLSKTNFPFLYPMPQGNLETMRDSQLPDLARATLEEIQGGLRSRLFTAEALVQVRVSVGNSGIKTFMYIIGVFETD